MVRGHRTTERFHKLIARQRDLEGGGRKDSACNLLGVEEGPSRESVYKTLIVLLVTGNSRVAVVG